MKKASHNTFLKDKNYWNKNLIDTFGNRILCHIFVQAKLLYSIDSWKCVFSNHFKVFKGYVNQNETSSICISMSLFVNQNLTIFIPSFY